MRALAIRGMSLKDGSNTPGVDGKAFSDYDLDDLNEYLRNTLSRPKKYKADTIKRVWIPKPGKTELRPLGIPTVKDRLLQTVINMALLPLVELTSDPNSYGFRPKRDCKMALGALRAELINMDPQKVAEGRKRRQNRINRNELDTYDESYTIASKDKVILDADIKGFFDNLNHE